MVSNGLIKKEDFKRGEYSMVDLKKKYRLDILIYSEK